MIEMKEPTNMTAKTDNLYDPTNPIAAAVLPLKEDAMKRAEEYAREIVAKVREDLKAAGNDLIVCAPYPSGNQSRASYFMMESRYRLFASLCVWRKSSYMMHEPHFADVDSNRVAKFIKEARENAAFQYEAFILKLIAKIGPVYSAKLSGNHVWSFSFLTVEKASGIQTTEIWKTQQIINVSKLGKVFAQWPTRKVKDAK